MMPANEFVEIRNGAYFVAGTRVGLDIVISEFNEGRSPESIFQAYPSIGSLANTYGVITFILSHPDAVQAYLKEQERRYEVLQAKHPLPSEMEERYHQL